MDRALQASAALIEQPTRHAHVVRQSPYLTAAEAADYLRYGSVRALYKAVKSLGIPHRKRGAGLLFLAAELDQWLVSRKRRAR